MSDPISTTPLGNDPVDSNEPDFVAQLGRISGKLLSANLLRNGVDLSFRNGPIDEDILYLQVTDRRIGINTETPIFDLDIDDFIIAKRLISDTAKIDDILFQSDSRISTVVGEINIRPGGQDPVAIFDRLQAGNIVFNENFILNSSINQNLIFSPSGSGTIELQNSTNILNNLYVTGDINLDGDLRTLENITVGDSTIEDRLTFTADINSDIKTAVDIAYDIGSSLSRWKNSYSDRLILSSTITTGNISIASPATILTSSGDLAFNLSGNDKTSIFNSGLSTPNFSIKDNKIKTIGNSDLELEASGTGKIQSNSDVDVDGDLYANNTSTIVGDFTVDGNAILGNNVSQDVLTILPFLQDDLIPSLDNIYDLGTVNQKWKDFYSDNIYVNDSLSVANISITNPGIIAVNTGNLFFNLSGSDKTSIFDGGLSTPNFSVKDNKIKTIGNSDLELDSSGTGKTLVKNNTEILSNLSVFGSLSMTGNLSTVSNIIIGDQPTDTVSINVDLDQDILPKTTLAFDLGKSNRRWRRAYIPDWTTITNIRPVSANVNQRMRLGGLNNITALVGNDDIIFDAATNTYEIEDIRFQDNDIINLLNTPLTLATVGIGYYRFEGNNAMQFPAGTSAERPTSPEIGDTRWNTDLGYLECFDGNVYIISIGPGDQLVPAQVEELNTLYSLFLG